MSAEERVGIVVEVKGGKEALSLMENLESAIKRLNGTKLKFDFGGKQIQGIVTATQKTEQLGSSITKTSAKTQSLGKVMSTTFNSVSSRMQHTGQMFSALGKTLERLSSPMSTLFRSTVWAAGFKALNMATEGLSGSFERYDTMQNYAKSMKALGLDADRTFKVFSGQKEAMTAIDNLNESVLGLPTGLDEIVAMQKVYAGATGEMVKSTKTAIAANNTFLASSMGSREQRFMQKYLVALASGAELTTMQWQSMARIAPLAMRAVSEELKYADYSQFTKDLQSGAIAGEQFLQSFIKVGTEGRVQEAANVMKTTFEGLSANVQNAFRRMGEGLLKSLDDVFIGVNGRNLIQNLLGVDAKGRKVGTSIKDIIDGFSSSLQNWVRENPDFFINFLNTLKSFDWNGLIRGMGKGLLELADTLKSFVGFFNGDDVGVLGNSIRSFFGLFGLKEAEDFGKFMAKMPLYSKSLVLLGGFLKGTKFFGGGIAAILKGLITSLGGERKGGIFGALGKIIGKKKDIDNVTDTLKTVPTVTQTMQRVMNSLSKTMTIFGTVALAGGAGFVAFRAVKTMIQDLKAIVSELNTMTREDFEMAAGVVTGMAVFFGSFAAISDYVGRGMTAITSIGKFFSLPIIKGGLFLAGLTTFASGVLALDMAMIKSAFNSFKSVTDSLKTGMENISDLKAIQFDKTALDRALSAFNDIQESLGSDDFYVGGGEGSTASDKARASKRASTIVENITGVIENIKKAITELNSLPDTSKIDDSRQKVSDVLWAMKNVYERALLDLDMKAGVPTTERENTIATNIAALISTIRGAIDDLKALEKIDIELDAAKENIVSIGQKMGEIFTELNQAFGQEFVTDYSSDFTRTSNEGVTDKQVTKAGNLSSMFDAFVQTIGYIRQAYEALVGGKGQMKLDPNTLTEIMEGITGENGVIAQMKSLFDQLIGEDTGFTSDVDFATPMANLVEAIGSIKSAIVKLREIGGIEFEEGESIDTVIDSIQNMISRLSTAFNIESVMALVMSINLFKTTVTNLISDIQNMVGMSAGNPLDIQITLNPSIKGDKETVKMIDDAAQAIRTAWSHVPKSLSRTISVSIGARVNTAGAVSAIERGASLVRQIAEDAVGVNTGGMIGNRGVLYRKNGGDVLSSIFKRKGTDTVPAMLTPGEYVHNKHAVDFWGIDFMRKINRMDMRGVINDVMSRASHSASIGRQTVVNNTYNNNQQVTINNSNGAGAGFTFRSASRFAGAL